MRTTVRLRLKPGIEAALRDASAELDEVMAALSLGLRDQAQFDALEQRAQRIARLVREAFRG